MNYELKELNMNMGKPEYDMYQDIPSKESGSTNLCNGLPYEVFKNYLETQMARKFQNINNYDTPAITYILYVANIPVGYICIRTKINDNWKKWSGNFYYAIRLSERKKGYGQSSNGNVASSKVIENNGGFLLETKNGSNYYKIRL